MAFLFACVQGRNSCLAAPSKICVIISKETQIPTIPQPLERARFSLITKWLATLKTPTKITEQSLQWSPRTICFNKAQTKFRSDSRRSYSRCGHEGLSPRNTHITVLTRPAHRRLLKCMPLTLGTPERHPRWTRPSR